MGFRICYVASRLTPDELAKSLNLEISGKAEELPDGVWWIANLKQSGWTILWSEDEEYGARSQDRLAASSRQADLIICEVNETCMWSSSAYWSEGKSDWKITHSGDGENIFDLTTHGQLPKQLNDIREQHFLTQKQDASCDHIFEIPLEVARAFIGFRHEDDLKRDDVDEFQIIKAPRATGFLSRILKR